MHSRLIDSKISKIETTSEIEIETGPTPITIVMKGKSEFSMALVKFQPQAKIFGATCAFLLACFFISIGIRGYSNSENRFTSISTSYMNINEKLLSSIKIIPADSRLSYRHDYIITYIFNNNIIFINHSDESLNLLPPDSFSYAAVIGFTHHLPPIFLLVSNSYHRIID